jgi:hypothetical protein
LRRGRSGREEQDESREREDFVTTDRTPIALDPTSVTRSRGQRRRGTGPATLPPRQGRTKRSPGFPREVLAPMNERASQASSSLQPCCCSFSCSRSSCAARGNRWPSRRSRIAPATTPAPAEPVKKEAAPSTPPADEVLTAAHAAGTARDQRGRDVPGELDRSRQQGRLRDDRSRGCAGCSVRELRGDA